MRIEQLEYIATVARLGSFSWAAQELHVSQPALSETVRKLEVELGVTILNRGRTGVTLTAEGREVLPHILEAIESVDRLRLTADDQHHNRRVVRLGTTAAATAPMLTPTIREFSERHQSTQIEIVTDRHRRLREDLLDSNLDLALVNLLVGDDPPPDLESVELLRGRPIACLRSDSPLAKLTTIGPDELGTQPLIAMRSGYLMHRYLHRLLDGRPVHFAYAADGADMGKLMVAQGLGVAVLPDYSVIGDPIEQSGAIVMRELDDETEVAMMLQRRPVKSTSGAAHDLHAMFLARARNVAAVA